MSFNQFSMVEELASLVKDNLPCKHLILSMEDSLVNFLREEDPSSDGMLELEPMNAYNRLLVHRLAEIFGFSHRSVGEGDDRRLVLERCLETSMPSVLVSDLLSDYDEFQPLTSSYQRIQSNKSSPVNGVETFAPSLPIRKRLDTDPKQALYDSELKSSGIAIGKLSLEDRQAAYLAARQRIFTGHDDETNGLTEKKPRGVSVVARRMITHALGKSIDASKQTLSRGTNDKTVVLSDNLKSQQKGLDAKHEPEVSRPRRSKIGVDKESLEQEHLGAAKRMFAHALGFPSGKDGIQKNSLK